LKIPVIFSTVILLLEIGVKGTFSTVTISEELAISSKFVTVKFVRFSV
jgi:hypothetical protein